MNKLKPSDIKVGDYVTTSRHRQSMRVEQCYNGSWTGLPIIECRDPLFQSLTYSVYVEDVTSHWRPKYESGSKSSAN